MEARQKIVFEVTKGENIYSFIVPDGAPLGEVYLVLGEMIDMVIEKINDHAEMRKSKEVADPQSEEENKKDEK